jgi:hypothetical protein
MVDSRPVAIEATVLPEALLQALRDVEAREKHLLSSDLPEERRSCLKLSH